MRTIAQAAIMLAAIGMASPAFGHQTIAANGTVKGRLERGDSKRGNDWIDSYTYNGEAGEELWIPWDGPADLEVRGPGGFSSTYARDGRLIRLPQRGRYTISIKLNASFTADYELSVFRVTGEPAPAVLSAGQTIQGGFITTDAKDGYGTPQDSYIYTARAGETAVFHLEGQHSDLFLEIKKDEKTTSLGRADAGHAVDDAVAFSDAGEYRVLVAGDGGNYTLSVQPGQASAAAMPVGHLRVGDSAQMRFSTDLPINEHGGFVNVYTVDAQRGEHLAIVSTNGVGIRGPDGQRVHENSVDRLDSLAYQRAYTTGKVLPVSTEFTAPMAGQYRIEVPVQAGMSHAAFTLQVMTAAQGASIMAEARTGAQAEYRASYAQALQRANQLLNSGDNSAAALAFIEAMNIVGFSGDQRDKIPALFGAGVAAFRQGDQGSPYGYPNAQMHFREVLRLEPNNQLAAANLAAAIQAEDARQRNQQAAYEQRKRENSQAIANMLGAFAVGVGIGNTINAAKAQANAPTVQAQVQSSPQQAYAPMMSSNPIPASGYRPLGDQTATQTFLDPTGRPCVQPVRNYTEPMYGGGTFYWWEFKNTCAIYFNVRVYKQPVDPGNTALAHESGISPNSTLKLSCYNDPRNRANSCTGFTRYEVRSAHH